MFRRETTPVTHFHLTTPVHAENSRIRRERAVREESFDTKLVKTLTKKNFIHCGRWMPHLARKRKTLLGFLYRVWIFDRFTFGLPQLVVFTNSVENLHKTRSMVKQKPGFEPFLASKNSVFSRFRVGLQDIRINNVLL